MISWNPGLIFQQYCDFLASTKLRLNFDEELDLELDLVLKAEIGSGQENIDLASILIGHELDEELEKARMGKT